MAYTTIDFKSKTALQKAIKQGSNITAFNPGLGPDLSSFSGEVYLEGPHAPAPHTWYAKAQMERGIIIRVK